VYLQMALNARAPHSDPQRRNHSVCKSEATLPLAAFLDLQRAPILDGAVSAVLRAHTSHYASAGPNEIRTRLEALFDRLVAAAASRDLGSVVAYAGQLARERYSAGYDLAEIQAAINALEEAVWRRVFSELQSHEFAEALGVVSTTLGAAKDALAREYVSLATHAHAPSLDLRALFAGIEHA
jgi:hypothetical protein